MATYVSRRGDGGVPGTMGAISGLGLAAAGANVVMQLARLPVGHGVARSTVDSGRIDVHPVKRTRTTLAYLVVALLGTEDERAYLRREVDRAHRQVHAGPDDPVPYDAFDPDLQRWVAACLYVGLEDVHRLVFGEPDADTAAALYRWGSRLGTTLQVGEELWPPDREAFRRYWDDAVERIEMDDLTRSYLRGIAGADFLGRPFRSVVGPLNRFLTVGFLPPPFRAELGLPWDRRRQRRFEVLVGTAAAANRSLPTPLRAFPFNAYLWDTRRRIRAGGPIV